MRINHGTPFAIEEALLRIAAFASPERSSAAGVARSQGGGWLTEFCRLTEFSRKEKSCAAKRKVDGGCHKLAPVELSLPISQWSAGRSQSH